MCLFSKARIQLYFESRARSSFSCARPQHEWGRTKKKESNISIKTRAYEVRAHVLCCVVLRLRHMARRLAAFMQLMLKYACIDVRLPFDSGVSSRCRLAAAGHKWSSWCVCLHGMPSRRIFKKASSASARFSFPEQLLRQAAVVQ